MLRGILQSSVLHYLPIKNLTVIVSIDRMLLRGPPLEGEYSDVGSPEGGIAEGVAEGVDGGVDVAETVGDVPESLRNYLITLLWSQDALHHRQHVVGCPGQDEDQQYGGQCLCCLPLLSLLLCRLLQLVLPWHGTPRI